MRLDDVHGATAGSLRKGMTTQRSIHPCSGDYILPGHSELFTKDPYSKSRKDKIVPDKAPKRETKTPHPCEPKSAFQNAARDTLGARKASAAPVGKLGDLAEYK